MTPGDCGGGGGGGAAFAGSAWTSHGVDGSERWSFRLEVDEGEYAGRTAGWDSITWSERGIHRVKSFLKALGVDVSGRVELAVADLVGLRMRATFELEEREDPLTGRHLLRLRVPYAGYGTL